MASMIRYVAVQIRDGFDEPDTKGFSWFDTVTDTYLSFDQEQIWKTWAEFEETFLIQPQGFDLDRFRRLYGGDKERTFTHISDEMFKNAYRKACYNAIEENRCPVFKNIVELKA